MGKAKKIKTAKGSSKVALHDQIQDSQYAKPKNRAKIRIRQDEEEEYVGANLSKKILRSARQQQQELEDEFGPTPAEAYGKNRNKITKLGHTEENESESDSEHDDDLEPDTFYENIVIDAADEKALEAFMNKNPEPRRTLADLITEKITEKQTELQSQLTDVNSIQIEDLDPKVRLLYEGVRDVLKKYRSGRIPKAFKIVPRLRNWEQILYVTDPASWSAAAMYQATRIFASNLTERMAQRFYNLVMLPRIRDDLAEYKRLNFHLYQALKKALFKPGAFMKGFLLPLLESGDCSLREAIIVGSVVARNSIPMLHSAAAILKIAEMDYTGANSVMLRIFFDKKYALPYRVVDAVVFHFLRFERDNRELPVLWHQALLTFVQRYKSDISSEQKEALLSLLRAQSHFKITPEIRRELQSAKGRDVEVREPEMNL